MGIIVKIGTQGQVMKYIKALLYGLQYLNNNFYSYVLSKFEELKYNSQIINLKKRLNDLFDPTLRRIYIITTTTVSLVWIYRYDENNPVYVDRYTEESKLYIKRYGETTANEDFIIYVPGTLVYNQVLFDSIVNRYKFSDKTYVINTYTP